MTRSSSWIPKTKNTLTYFIWWQWRVIARSWASCWLNGVQLYRTLSTCSRRRLPCMRFEITIIRYYSNCYRLAASITEAIRAWIVCCTMQPLMAMCRLWWCFVTIYSRSKTRGATILGSLPWWRVTWAVLSSSEIIYSNSSKIHCICSCQIYGALTNTSSASDILRRISTSTSGTKTQ